MPEISSKLVAVAAIGAAALGGGAIASAASSGTTSSTSTAPAASHTAPGGPQHDRFRGGHTLNGDVEAKVRAAALAKVPGTVQRVETNVDSSAPYEAHIIKSDGTEVEVQVNNDFSVHTVNDMGGMHP